MALKGKIKFYSTEKGYGFIFDENHGDLFFHITDVNGADAPSVGDIITYEIKNDAKNNKPKAIDVTIIETQILVQHEETETNASIHNHKRKKTLNGFPCIRGSTISGFKVSNTIGRISVGGASWYNLHFSTANQARDALIDKDKRKGANAIIEFSFHNDRQLEKGFFGQKFKNYFWAEGIAVQLSEDE